MLAAGLARPLAGKVPALAQPSWRVGATWFAAGAAATLAAFLPLALLSGQECLGSIAGLRKAVELRLPPAPRRLP
jgi:hypothetical protein